MSVTTTTNGTYMAFVQWKDEYNTGQSAIDFDHKTLVTITNELFDELVKGSSPATILRLFKNLTDYVHRHFEREEEILRATEYPNIHGHAYKHREIEQVMGKLFLRYQEDPSTLKQSEVVDFLRRWIRDHILNEDHEFIEYLDES